ncbi:lipid A biosynthesis lauroyl acyltransferase [Nonlabens marinus S1-08]|uniref:Lipid A biosynthesis lauroyl acyltransferase n=2 Tax=Nonlabens TaxID=363408 RepID=W8VWL0_9FLAO|nr:lipid A biosynthesis lauroyl acyltransferase [Nonlabens marinus S1-08]
MQAVAFYLAYPIIWLIARLPFPAIYFISDGVYILVYHVLRYRREVIFKNIKTAFPELSEKEVIQLSKQSTRHFCDIFVEMVKSTGISSQELHDRFVCDNLEEINAFAKAEQPIVILIGHQASYEWTMSLDDFIGFTTYAVYKPIKNAYFDNYIRKVRSKFGSILIPMKKAYHIMQERQKSKSDVGLYALVADQSPKAASAQFFTTFFDQITPVFMGGERISKEYGMPVFFLQVEKVKRGYYKAHFEKVTDDASQEPKWMVTDTFFQLLEKQIRKQPQYYLWTHKRWKVKPEDARRAVELSPRVPQ